ncbi:hypothetical protein Sjap_021543 [Stephania japonica]|uniref:Protein kinase domain-containing protein n=1 Tax=Stephania japonica TaxID=461633 RepID=A0AAP0HTK1_9MAGN
MERRTWKGEESVIVVMDANRTKGSVDTLSWALHNVVKPRDTVVVLGILCELGKKSYSCFPFHMGVGISAIWERIEFSVQGDVTPQYLVEEIAKKREQYQSTLQPFYQQCKKNKVKLEVKLVAGFDPKIITLEEAHKSNTRWIVLDSHLKRDKAFIHEHARCNIAAMKGKYVATILSRVAKCKQVYTESRNVGEEDMSIESSKALLIPGKKLDFLQEESSTAILYPLSPCWSPPSWKIGFPRKFDYVEVESITSKFSDECLVLEDESLQVYKGCLMETPVLVKCFSGSYDCFWSELKILAKVHHRYISNLVGFCRTGACMYLLQDYSCKGSLDSHLQCDEQATGLSWKVRLEIALKIGSCLRYLHEECDDGPIAHLSIRSSNILFCHGCSVMLTDFTSARCLKANNACNEDMPAGGTPVGEEEMEVIQNLSLDVHAYGLLLLELITGKKAHPDHNCKADPNFLDWVMPLIENDSLSEVMDPRLMDSGETREVHQMATAALHCRKSGSANNKHFISEVLVILQER